MSLSDPFGRWQKLLSQSTLSERTEQRNFTLQVGTRSDVTQRCRFRDDRVYSLDDLHFIVDLSPHSLRNTARLRRLIIKKLRSSGARIMHCQQIPDALPADPGKSTRMAPLSRNASSIRGALLRAGLSQEEGGFTG